MTIDEDIREIRTEQVSQGKILAVLHDSIVGNGREGISSKVDRHGGYFKMIFGGWFVLAVIWAVFTYLY